MEQRPRELLHPLWIRLCHWVHGISIVMLILTGLQIRFPDVFVIFPNLKRAVSLHNFFGFVVLFTFFAWFAYYAAKRTLVKQYVPSKDEIILGMPFYANYYFIRYFLGDPHPFEPTPEVKFNPLQKTTYFGIMFIMVPLQVITGLLLWDIKTFRPIIEAVGGVRVVDALHIILAYVFCAFLLVHLYLATLGHTFFSHFKAMIVGYED
ncbi:MAG: cytochrome b [Deltaproteobacteria bacterium]|nr:MAG: cytochrome b [Deltaproteobacteria bacterium]